MVCLGRVAGVTPQGPSAPQSQRHRRHPYSQLPAGCRPVAGKCRQVPARVPARVPASAGKVRAGKGHPYMYCADSRRAGKGHPYMYCADSRILVDFEHVYFISIRFAIAGGSYG